MMQRTLLAATMAVVVRGATRSEVRAHNWDDHGTVRSESHATDGDDVLAMVAPDGSVTASHRQWENSGYTDTDYQNPAGDAAGDGDGDGNENWPTVRCDADGFCSGRATNTWVPTQAALQKGLSIVIHDTPNENAKMYCADLAKAGLGSGGIVADSAAPVVYEGQFHKLPSFPSNDYANSEGTAELRVSSAGIESEVSFSGLPLALGDKNFSAHLHALPCNQEGGGHYQHPSPTENANTALFATAAKADNGNFSHGGALAAQFAIIVLLLFVFGMTGYALGFMKGAQDAADAPASDAGGGDVMTSAATSASGEAEGRPKNLVAYTDWALNTQVGDGVFQAQILFMCGLAYGIVCLHTYGNSYAAMATTWHRVGSLAALDPTPEIGDCAVPLREWEVDTPGLSLVGDFMLICENAWKKPMLGSIYFFGFGLGVVTCGSVADFMGRKWGYIYAYLSIAVGGTIAPLSTSWTFYAVARCLIGFGVGGLGITSFVWMSEFLSLAWRPVTSWVPNVLFSFGQITVSPIRYMLTDWRPFLWAGNIVASVGIWYWPFIHESPRWLAMQGKTEETYEVLCAMAKRNGQALPPAPRDTINAGVAASKSQGQKTASDSAGEAEAAVPSMSESLQQCFSPELRFRFIGMAYCWFAVSYAFYGLGFFSPNLPMDPLIANVFSGVVAIPAYMMSQPMIGSAVLGRKGTCGGGFLIGSACLLAATFVKGVGGAMFLYYLSCSFLSMVFGVIYIWAAELFPLDIRARAMSFQSVAARVGAILAPHVVAVGETNVPLALTMFALPCMAAGLISLAMPETRGVPAPNSLAELRRGLLPEEARPLTSQGHQSPDTSMKLPSESSKQKGRGSPQEEQVI